MVDIEQRRSWEQPVVDVHNPKYLCSLAVCSECVSTAEPKQLLTVAGPAWGPAPGSQKRLRKEMVGGCDRSAKRGRW